MAVCRVLAGVGLCLARFVRWRLARSHARSSSPLPPSTCPPARSLLPLPSLERAAAAPSRSPPRRCPLSAWPTMWRSGVGLVDGRLVSWFLAWSLAAAGRLLCGRPFARWPALAPFSFLGLPARLLLASPFSPVRPCPVAPLPRPHVSFPPIRHRCIPDNPVSALRLGPIACRSRAPYTVSPACVTGRRVTCRLRSPASPSSCT